MILIHGCHNRPLESDLLGRLGSLILILSFLIAAAAAERSELILALLEELLPGPRALFFIAVFTDTTEAEPAWLDLEVSAPHAKVSQSLSLLVLLGLLRVLSGWRLGIVEDCSLLLSLLVDSGGVTCDNLLRAM